MKKKYMQPQALVLTIRTEQMIAVSGNFSDGETTTTTVNVDDDLDGDQAWARGFHNELWDIDDDVW